MHFTRRQFVVLTGALSISPFQSAQANEGDTLFWQATRADQSIAIFGSERVNAALVPDIVSDGDRISDHATMAYTDLGPNSAPLRFSTNIKQVPPVLPDLPPRDADDLRRIMPPAAGMPVERLPGYVVGVLLMGEGQHPPEPSVDTMILDRIRFSGKPISSLISDDELKSVWVPPDALDLNAVGAHQISYLLEKRRRLGPIGGYIETLYEQRRASEIARLHGEFANEGLINPLGSLASPQFKKLLVERIMKLDSAKNFILLPLAILPGDDGVLQQLRSGGFQVRPLA
jgi:hypothetical protein